MVDTSMAGTIPLIRFQIVPMDRLPAGRSCLVVESDGELVASIGEEHGTGALCTELTHLHRPLTDQGRWVQTPMSSGPSRIEQPAEGRGLARVAWERVPATFFPEGNLVSSLEREGLLVWLLDEGHASEQLCTDMCAYGERIVGDGLWQQRWPD